MANNRIAIIGLGSVGASIGLALRKARQDLVIVGTDRDAELAGRMLKLGAVDRLERRPALACQEAGLVILAEPLQDMAAIMEGIAHALLPGCVVTDIAPLKTDVMRWAQELLPDNVSFVGGHPLIVAEAGNQPHAELFAGIEYCLVPAPNAGAQAVEVVSGLVALLGARPYFLDAAEHDGLMAAVEGLPHLLQLALMAALSEAGSWRENQRAAGRAFINATMTLDEEAEPSAYRHRLNRQNLARWIEIFQKTLGRIQAELLDEKDEPFKQRTVHLHDARRQWLHDRDIKGWERAAPPVEVDKRSIWKRMFWPELPKPDKD